MTSDELDRWAPDVVMGLFKVLTFGDPQTGRREYPAVLEQFVWLALRRIERRGLRCDPRAVALAEQWLIGRGPARPLVRYRGIKRRAAKKGTRYDHH